MSLPEIFVSYRRDDTGGYARALFDHLSERFPDRVFLDWEGIEVGENFIAKLESIGKSCRVLLALIGKNWLTATDAAGNQRIAQPADFVHQEIATALQRNIPVIPVLFQGVTIPGQGDLPDSLKSLTACNAVSVTDANYQSDLERLTRGIEAILGENQATVVHAVRRTNDWTTATAFGKDVSVEFSFTPKRKQIVWMTVGGIVVVAIVLAVIFYFASGSS